ncbi:metal ABC transporter ATP-binding protein [bacterium]|nr:metal ABC transporter ATP-binding protein [bacterium]
MTGLDKKDNNILQFDNVTFSYNSTAVLENVSFTLGQNELAYIVGPNGGGKTTLLRLILGLLQPSTGNITVYGRPAHEARSKVGYTPQHSHFDPHFPISVLEIVLMGRLNSSFFGRYTKSDRKIALNALDEMGLLKSAESPFASLSGGQRQRVLIARALASQPELLLLDEPTANVDIEGEERLTEIIYNLSNKMTILMVSHDLRFAAESVHRVICVNRHVAVHPTTEITDETIRSMYGENIRLIRHDIGHSERDPLDG